MNPGISIATDFLWNMGSFLLITAWILWSTHRIWKFYMSIHTNWGRWQTFPIPDKRAVNHMAALLVLIGANALLTWFGIMWFL